MTDHNSFWLCCNLSSGVALIVWFTTSGMCVQNNTIIYVARAIVREIAAHDLYCWFCAYAARVSDRNSWSWISLRKFISFYSWVTGNPWTMIVLQGQIFVLCRIWYGPNVRLNYTADGFDLVNPVPSSESPCMTLQFLVGNNPFHKIFSTSRYVGANPQAAFLLEGRLSKFFSLTRLSNGQLAYVTELVVC